MQASDPQSSFVAARYLSRVVQFNANSYVRIQVRELIGHYIHEVTKDPERIEWSNLNVCFKRRLYPIGFVDLAMPEFPENARAFAETLIRYVVMFVRI